ncbi:MAG: AAA family ATPase [Chloroflexaceae bacterium]
MLTRRLHDDENDGIQLLAAVARNPFQRPLVQRVLYADVHTRSAPLQRLYTLLTTPALDMYAVAPLLRLQWKRIPTSRALLLGEVAGRWVDMDLLGEQLLWFLTRYRRKRRPTPLTHFAGMLYELLDAERIDADDFDLLEYREIYTDLETYPGGVELARTFAVLATFLAYADLEDLAGAAAVVQAVQPLPDAPLRPTLLTALERLGEIGMEVAAYRAATSRVNRQAALLRATDALDALDAYAAAEVVAPEATILQRVARQWRRIISEEGGAVGRIDLSGPVENPYVLNNPVQGALFVGREDILRRLEDLWTAAGAQVPSVLLYGHRRMGKSSILQNLGPRFGAGTTIVDFNLQRVGMIRSTGELLYNLALALYDCLPRAAQAELGEPEEERFTAHNPYTALDRFLRQLDGVRGPQRLIITLDEFELIEQRIAAGRLDPELIDFWRGLIQTYPWLIMALAGLHTLREMTHDYWNPLFGSVTPIPVSFLTPGAARRLITEPAPDFAIDYDEAVIAQMIALTNCQPFLIQLIGHTLVTRFNRQTFETGVERARRFSLADLQAVIDTEEFYGSGNAAPA